MNKNKNKILAIGIASVFALIFVSGLVSAANPIADWFTSWEEGEQFSANIAKYLLWALVAMLVYGVSDKFPGLEGKEYVKWPFAIIVGFLSMAYITPAEVIAMMGAYSGLGFALSIAVPLLILVFFTADLATKEGSPKTKVMYELVSLAMWLAFTFFLLTRAMGAPDGSKTLSWVLFGIACIMTFSVKPIMGMIKKQVHKERKKTVGEAQEMIGSIDKGGLKRAKELIKEME
jgi:ABC-type multidrug transport system fused ATPase/permease subunit